MENYQSQFSIEQLRSLLLEHHFHFDSQYSEELSKTIIAKDYNSITFLCKLGYYYTEISLLKVHLKRDFFHSKIVSYGSFGCVYQFQDKWSRKNAIKSQQISTKDRASLNKNIDAIIEEYFFYKIASILRVGPFLEQIFGYDIVCYDDSIEFAMEMCEVGEELEF